ncbi:MAG: glycine zipper protein [Flaviaesturariibacter sp.]|nr:glycine zipper protein [Flaviaesturariibacter sp.]
MSAASLMVACNSNPNVSNAAQKNASADTVGLAAFNAAKQEQALAAQIAAAPVAEVAAVTTKPAVRTITRYVPVRSVKHTSSSSHNAKASTSASSGNSAPVVASAPQVINSESSNAAKEKKGISKAAKGAIIGGVAGAVGGAVINKKNRAVGAVIGGVVGAAGGYGIGRGMDKKDGRYFTTPGFAN